MRLNPKERAIALLAGNGAIVVQAFLFIEGQSPRLLDGTGLHHLASDARFAMGLLFFSVGGIGAVGFWGCFQALRALGLVTGATDERPSPADKKRFAQCERLITNSLFALGANVGIGLVSIMIVGGLAMVSSDRTGPHRPALDAPATAIPRPSAQ